jgi:hypothetical protein
MTVLAEALAGSNAIIVDYTQRPPVHVCGVVIVGERKAVPAIEPAVIGMTALCGCA